jgi:hypothetical protein
MLPPWADEEISRQLSLLCAKGEGQYLEYKQTFPRNISELGKEMAAFATSGGGVILIGVNDDGQLVGIENADQMSVRDEYLKRLQGIANGTVSPPLTPKVGFAYEAGRAVLFVRVHKGSEPVYYGDGRPYVRHLTESRLAKPEEVVRRVLTWAGLKQSDKGIQPDVTSEHVWKSRLDQILLDLVVVMDEMPRLSLNPGPDHLQFTCENCAQWLRQLVTEYLHDETAVAESLGQLADKCDLIACAVRFGHSQTWSEIDHPCQAVRAAADELRSGMIGNSLIDGSFFAEAARTIKLVARKAHGLLGRVDQMVGSGRCRDLLSEAAEIGHALLQFAYAKLPFLLDDEIRSLREVAVDLHFLRFHDQWYECSGSESRLHERLAEQTSRIEAIAARLD